MSEKVCHNIEMRVFVHEGEDEEAIKTKFLEFLPKDLEKEKIGVKRTVAEGQKDIDIIIYQVMLIKDRHVNIFLKHLMKNLDHEQKELLLRQKESRMDDQLNFFLRLDKEMLLEDKFLLTDGGDCFHIRMNIAAFPNKREQGFKVLERLLTQEYS